MVTVVETNEAPPAVAVSEPSSMPDARAVATPPPRTNWGYAAVGKRDLRLDLLRGYAVSAMVVDHIGGASWLYILTGGNRFFVSAAEAFVFISGVTVGIVYGDRVRANGFRDAATKLLARSWTLYALAVWLAITSAFAAAVADLPRGSFLTENPARFILDVITLRRTFYLVDVMLLYAFVMLVAPLALALLSRRLWWLLALASWGLWAAYQFFPMWLKLPWSIADNPVFNFASWQLLFFSGMSLGYGRDWLGQRFATRWLRSPLRDGWIALLALLLGGMIWVHATNGAAFDAYAPGGDAAALLDAWFDKSALPPARLLACAVVFSFAWVLVTRYWRPIRAAVGPFLLPLGQGALYAYAAHLFLVVAANAIVLRFWNNGREVEFSTLDPGVDAVLQIAALAILWALTKARYLQSLTAPLGAPPIARLALRGAERWRIGRFAVRFAVRPGDSLVVVLAAALLSGGFLLPGGLSGSAQQTAAVPIAEPSGVAGSANGSQARPNPRPPGKPESTITAPRKIGGNVQGSTNPVLRGAQQGGAVNSAPAAPPPEVAVGGAGSETGQGNTSAPPADSPVSGTSGGYLRDSEFFSAILGRTMPYGIYFPPGYDSSPTRRYPVLYMLHGVGGHYSEWVAYGLPEIAEGLTAAGQIQPMLIVMPQGDQSYWTNHVDTDNERWGDYVAFDLVAHIDATYRSIPVAESRAIGGLSMGGFGALQLAFNNPTIFHVVGAHSPSLRPYSELTDLFGDSTVFARFDPLALATTIERSSAPLIWLDVGVDDEWETPVADLANILRTRGITHELLLATGGHTSDYWTIHGAQYLYFYSSALRGEGGHAR